MRMPIQFYLYFIHLAFRPSNLAKIICRLLEWEFFGVFMSKLLDLQSQIEKLQKQANEIKSKEFTATVIEIQKLMSAYGITIKDLQTPKIKAKAGRQAKTSNPPSSRQKKDKATVSVKYKGPNGETWTGRGLMPRWLSSLVNEGHSKESFLIKSSDELPTPSAA